MPKFRLPHRLIMVAPAFGALHGCLPPLPPPPFEGDSSSSSADLPTATSSSLSSGSTATSTPSSTAHGETSVESTGSAPPVGHEDVYIIPPCADRSDYPWSPPIGLLDNDEFSGSSPSIRIEDSPTRGSITLTEDGIVEYTPYRQLAESDSFTYIVTDEAGRDSAPTTVRLQTTHLQLGAADDDGRYLTIKGKPGGYTGISVASAGDANHDSIADVVIGAHRVNTMGEVYLLYGRRGRRSSPVDLADQSLRFGTTIHGAHPNGYIGVNVASAGSVASPNEDEALDGFDDLIISEWGFQNDHGNHLGRVYLVYGQEPTTDIWLETLAEDNNGFVLFEGTTDSDFVGLGIDGGTLWKPERGGGEPGFADLNRDGLPDILVGYSRYTSPHTAGGVAWIHDLPDRTQLPLTVNHPSLRSIQVEGVLSLDPPTEAGQTPGSGFGFGHSTRILGDINADGIPELAVASDTLLESATPDDEIPSDRTGKVHIFLSPSDTTAAPLSPTDADLTLSGAPGDRLGAAITDVDLNTDGLNDLIVGAPGRSFGAIGGGQVYVIYGGSDLDHPPSLIDLDNEIHPPSGPTGLVIQGDFTDNAEVGRAFDDAGDFNGDGYRDLVIGTPLVTDESIQTCARDGITYVIFGFPSSEQPTAISLDEITCSQETLSDDGPRRRGIAILAEQLTLPACTGWSVAGIGDFDHDGCDDIIVGAPSFDPPYSDLTDGRAYIVYGFDPDTPDQSCPSPPTIAKPRGSRGLGQRVPEEVSLPRLQRIEPTRLP